MSLAKTVTKLIKVSDWISLLIDIINIVEQASVEKYLGN